MASDEQIIGPDIPAIHGLPSNVFVKYSRSRVRPSESETRELFTLATMSPTSPRSVAKHMLSRQAINHSANCCLS